MHRCWLATLTALAFLGGAASSAETIQLRVLYAGNSGSERAKDFVSFLQKHFAKVGSVQFGKFKESDAKEYDVVVFDWTSIYPRDKTGKIDNKVGNIKSPTPPRLSQDFARATLITREKSVRPQAHEACSFEPTCRTPLPVVQSATG